MKLTRKIMVLAFIMLPCMLYAQSWKVNLKNADIGVFLNQVSEITGKNFILDPRVKGKVTVISNMDLDKKGVLRLLFSVLSVHGYAAIQTSSGIKVVPESNAKQSGLSFDENGAAIGDTLVTQVIPIKHEIATELVPIIRPLIPPFGHLAAAREANALIVSDRAENISELIALINRLDQGAAKTIRVVSLKHAWAGDLLALLKNLDSVPALEHGAPQNQGGTTRVIADESTNRLIIKGSKEATEQLEVLIHQLDKPAQRSNRLHVVPLRYADAKDTAELITSLLGADKKEKDKADHGGSIIKSDVGMNRLVISAEPSVMADLMPIIQELDIPRAQVLVEAVIVEVSMDNNNALGFQWLLGDTSGTSTPVFGSNFNNVGTSISDIANNILDDKPSLSTGATAGILTRRGGLSLAGILQAINSNSNANLLSTPKIMTLDNQKSKILVGETRPFQTGGYSRDSDSAFITTERKDIGLTLEVTPHINAGDEVKMDVSQIVEAASSEKSNLGTITTKREINTTVIAGNNETIVLGGLMQDNITEVHQKVPVFGDLPVLGALFRSSSLKKTKRNLLVFIRPTILRDKKHVNAITQDHYRVFKSIELTMPNGSVRPATIDSILN
ncbi:Type II secretion system protein D precursor [Marinomonas spartinae]|uniref:Type II secretion system protein D n=1 Tax=Marinomonas spartinae TaxID=1792290 RepID=A0A1A8TSZ0_9GAMM|nr:type II secretion system secretin GspD [Marinomonas spartinae]SBS37921.1 Type II secretion system protein D precursor [Marinomonas spartinae]